MHITYGRDPTVQEFRRILRVIQFADETKVQSDGRIRKWAWIPEAGKFLRVILLEDGKTVHNAFFDRSYKEKKQ
jgi:hypothetical protein